MRSCPELWVSVGRWEIIEVPPDPNYEGLTGPAQPHFLFLVDKKPGQLTL